MIDSACETWAKTFRSRVDGKELFVVPDDPDHIGCNKTWASLNKEKTEYLFDISNVRE